MAKKKKQKQRKKKGGGAAEVPDGERVEPSKQAALSAEPATQTSGGAVRAKTKRERDSILNEVLSGFSISDSLPWDETYVITSKRYFCCAFRKSPRGGISNSQYSRPFCLLSPQHLGHP